MRLARSCIGCLGMLVFGGMLGARGSEAGQPVERGAAMRPAAGQAVDGTHSRRVDVWVKGSPLGELLAEISGQAGVALAADAAVADQKVTVLAKDIDLENLKRALATLYDYRWSAGKRGASYDYVLRRPANCAVKAAALLELPTKVLDAELTRTLAECVRSGVPARLREGLSPEDVAYLAPQFRARARILSLLSPEERRSLLRGARLRYAVRDLGGEHKGVLEAFVREHAMPEKGGGTADHWERARVEFSSQGWWIPGRGDLHFTISYVDDPTVGSAYNLAADADRCAQVIGRRTDALRKGERQSPEEKAALAPRGELDVRVAIASKDGSGQADKGGRRDRLQVLADVLEDIARSAKVNIVSDFHTKPPQVTGSLSELRLGEALDRTADTYGHYWNATGKAYLFRSDRWWADDAAEVPERLIRRWKAALDENGYLPLAALAEIACLRDAQIGSLALVIPGSPMVMQRGTLAVRPVLQVYAALDESARAMAEAKGGLPCGLLPKPQRALLYEAMNGWVPQSGHAHADDGEPTGVEAIAGCDMFVRTDVSAAQWECHLSVRRHEASGLGHVLRQPVRHKESEPPEAKKQTTDARVR